MNTVATPQAKASWIQDHHVPDPGATPPPAEAHAEAMQDVVSDPYDVDMDDQHLATMLKNAEENSLQEETPKAMKL